MKWEDGYLLDFGIHFCTLLLLRMVIIIIFGKPMVQAAKEFESELKKEPDSTEGDSSEKSIVVSEKQQQQDNEVSTSKETV